MKIKASLLTASACLALITGTAISASASAQEQNRSSSAGSSDSEDIVVTGSYTTNEKLDSATGLGLSIKETPQSVTVMTARRMEDQAIRTLSDVVNNAAGVSAKALDSARNGFSARGFDIDNYQVDGVPVQWDVAYTAGESLLDVGIYEQIEIVRGATGLLTGAGNPSASINMIRKHATSDRFTATITGTASRWDTYGVMADVSTPITSDGSVRARAVAKYEDSGSFTDYLKEKRLVLYGIIDADLTPTTQLSIGASFQKNDPRGTQWGGLPVWYSDGSRTDWRRSKTAGARWTRWASTNESYFLTVNQQLSDRWELKFYSSLSVNKGDLRLLFVSGTPDRATGLGMSAGPSRYDSKLEQIDIGARLTGKYDLFGREHELILGTSYAEQSYDYMGYDAATTAPVGNFLEWDGNHPQPRWTNRTRRMDLRTQQWGYFGATRLSIADPLKIILGGRLASWTRKGMAWGTLSDFGSRDRFLPYAGLLLDVTPDHTLYASYTKIYQPQSAQDRNGDFLPPVTGENYEGGLKSSFFDGRLNTAISVFHIKQDNLAQPDIGFNVPGSSPPAQASRAARGTKSTGFEIEANGDITPGWNVAANYTQFKAKDADGNRVNTLYAQKLLRFFTTYDFQGGLTIGGGVNWEGLSYTDTNNAVTGNPERLKVKPYALVNLMTRYAITDNFSAQLNVENLFDKKYYSQIGFYNQLAYGEPRNVTLTLRYRH